MQSRAVAGVALKPDRLHSVIALFKRASPPCLWISSAIVDKGLRQGALALKGLDSGVKVVLIVLVTLNIG